MFGVRGLMGACVGAVYGPSFAAVSEESPPEKRGHYVGFAQSFWPLIGMGIGPIVAGYLMATVGWRWSFALIAVPGIICVLWLASFMKEPASVAANIKRRKETGKRTLMHEGKEVHIWDVLKYRNVLLATLISVATMAYLFVLFSFVPVFFGKVHGLNPVQTGWVMCGGGFLTWIGQIIMPRISDKIGRKPALLFLFALGAIGGILFAVAPAGTSLPLLAFYFALFCAGLSSYPLFLAIVPTESVPFTIAASAVAVAQGVGEVIGATVFPAIGGWIAQAHGLTATMYMVVCAQVACFICSLFLKETAPRVVAKRAKVGQAAGANA
jgi:MFS family permease